ncbi:hypothetical protein ACIA8C_01690 [Nocardia sp. NPDC051321]
MNEHSARPSSAIAAVLGADDVVAEEGQPTSMLRVRRTTGELR